MKYKKGDYLWYVDPFIFNLFKVYICHQYELEDGNYYMEQTGAILHEDDLFENFNEAKSNALNKLRKFYIKKEKEIDLTNEEGILDEND